MRLRYRLLFICSSFLYLPAAFAQQIDSLRKITSFYTELGGYAVLGKSMPFWLRANQYGTVPLVGSIGTVRVGLVSDYRPKTATNGTIKARRFDWGYGVDAVANAGAANQLILTEAYAKVHFGAIEFYAGRRKGITGFVDTTLTSGAYAWSGNALPIPKVQIGTIGFAPLGFTKGVIAINTFFNHGWFNDGFVQHSYLHQKAFYMRVGKPHWRVKLYGGGNDEVQWGGYAPGLVGAPGLAENGYLPSNLNAFFRVVTTIRGTGYFPPQGTISVDQGNRIGNHLGSFDLGMDLTLGSVQIMMYRQNLYETGSLFYLTNIQDGLNGIRIQRRESGAGVFSVDRVVVEFFYSKSQGGPEFILTDPKRRGRNNYFNQLQYRDGWTYMGRTIGTPFFTQRTELASGTANTAIANNRISLVHVAASGTLFQRIQWLAKLSYSQNFGTYDNPFPDGTNQFSGLINAAVPVQLPALGPCQLNASLALDQGKLLNNATGLYLGLRKTVTTRRASVSPAESSGAATMRQ